MTPRGWGSSAETQPLGEGAGPGWVAGPGVSTFPGAGVPPCCCWEGWGLAEEAGSEPASPQPMGGAGRVSGSALGLWSVDTETSGAYDYEVRNLMQPTREQRLKRHWPG